MKLFKFFLGFAPVFGLVSVAQADTVDIGTANAANWTVTADGSTFAAFELGGAVTMTSTGNSLGASPIDLTKFDGVWLAKLTFTFPADAINIALNTTSLLADDKLVVSLNGTDIGNALVGGGTGAGTFFRNGASESVVYSGNQALSVSSGFVLGGTNNLIVYVNNTDTTDPNAAPSNFAFPTADTAFELAGAVTYSESAQSAVPEPQSALWFGLGGAILAGVRRLRSKLGRD
jgi:hypothetical protein